MKRVWLSFPSGIWLFQSVNNLWKLAVYTCKLFVLKPCWLDMFTLVRYEDISYACMILLYDLKLYHMLVWYYCTMWRNPYSLVRLWLFPSRQVTYSFQTDLCVLQVVEARLWVLIVHPSSWGIAMNFLESRSFLGLASFITAERERPWPFLPSLAN